MLIHLIAEVQRNQWLAVIKCCMIVEDQKQVVNSENIFLFCGNCFDAFTASNGAMN